MSTLVTTNLKNPSNPGNNLVLEANGSVLFSAGTSTVPSISFTGDLNTGIYSPGADQVAISTAGSGRLFVDASGNIGVGTASPFSGNGTNLHVLSTGTARLWLQSTTASTGRQFYVESLGTGGLTVVDGTAGQERLRITSAGLVGVGTSSPSYTLQVAETSAVVSAASYSTFFGQGTRADLILQATSSNNDQQRQVIRSNSDSLIFGTENAAVTTFTEKLRIDSSGRVGIGNSSLGSYNASSDDLVVGDHVGAHGVTICSQNNSSGYIMFADGTTGPQTYAGQITYDHTNNRLTLGTNDGTTGLTVDSSQRVGIGTTTPQHLLDCTSIGRFTGSTNSAASGAGIEIGYDSGNTTGFIQSYNRGSSTYLSTAVDGSDVRFKTSSTERARIDSSGRLLVGTSSSRQISGNTAQIQLEGTDTNNSAFSITTNSNNNQCGYLVFGKSRGTAIGGTTVVQADDFLGRIDFAGANGSNVTNIAALIAAQVDGAVSGGGANDMPGRLVFSTTADGASSPTERLRITSAGLVGIGTSSPSQLLTTVGNIKIAGAQASNNAKLCLTRTDRSWSINNETDLRFYNGSGDTDSPPTASVVFSSSGSVGIGTTSPSSRLHVLNPSAGPEVSTIERDNSGVFLKLYRNAGSGNQGGLIGADSAGTYFAGGTSTAEMLYIDSGNSVMQFFTSGSERVRIDSSGRLLVGTSSSSAEAKFIVQGGATAAGGAINIQRNATTASAGSTIGFINFANSANNVGATISADGDGTWSAGTSHPTLLKFSTTADGASSPTERMRISQNGTVTINGPGGGTFLNLSNSGGYSGLHEVDNTAYTIGQNSNVRAMRIGSGSTWLTTGVNLAPGGTSWGTYSDERLKTDIVELTDCLDNIKGIRCVSYRLTDVDDVNSKKRIGVIAQDLVGKYDQAINASRRSENDETEYLSVQYSDLIPVLLKALQEASVKIESLEARLTAAGI